MASRKEQKEKLRLEREQREAEAKAAERRKRLVGYGAGGAIALVAVIIAAVLLASGGGGDGTAGENSDVLPGGGSVPEQKLTDVRQAARAAECELKSFRATSREHTMDINERIPYASKPPTSGRHFDPAAPDGAFEESPDVKQLVHSMEHGRVIVWFKRNLPRDDRANLRALFDDDDYQMLITPDTTGMKYAVAATAWNLEPEPNGTGRLLGCPRVTPAVYDALRAFRDEYRGNGPEPVP